MHRNVQLQDENSGQIEEVITPYTALSASYDVGSEIEITERVKKSPGWAKDLFEKKAVLCEKDLLAVAKRPGADLVEFKVRKNFPATLLGSEAIAGQGGGGAMRPAGWSIGSAKNNHLR